MEDTTITRIMPNSLEAEQSVVGSMIMDKQAIITAGEILTQEDFYHKQYGVMFQAMTDMNNDGRIVDIVTLQEKLKEKNVPPEVYSLEFIRELLESVPTSANIRQYSKIVKDKVRVFVYNTGEEIPVPPPEPISPPDNTQNENQNTNQNNKNEEDTKVESKEQASDGEGGEDDNLPPEEALENFLKQHEKYRNVFKMLKLGVPTIGVRQKVKTSGLDSDIFEQLIVLAHKAYPSISLD